MYALQYDLFTKSPCRTIYPLQTFYLGALLCA